MKLKTLALFCAMTLFIALGITVQTFAQNAQPISASQTEPKAQAKILDQCGKLPLNFEANHGQTDARVKFLSRTGGYTLFLTGDIPAEVEVWQYAAHGQARTVALSRQSLPRPVKTVVSEQAGI